MYERAFAKLIPTQSAGSSPGPVVTAIASIYGLSIPSSIIVKADNISGSLSNNLSIFFFSCVFKVRAFCFSFSKSA